MHPFLNSPVTPTQNFPLPSLVCPVSSTAAYQACNFPLSQGDYSKIRRITDAMCKNHDSWAFKEAVDPHKHGAANYFEFIKHPMDLSIVQNKINQKAYATLKSWCDDVEQIFVNCLIYNQDPNNAIRISAIKLRQFWLSKLSKEFPDALVDTQAVERRRELGITIDSPILPPDYIALINLVKKCQKSSDASAFNQPVSAFEVPTYHQFIQQPMDLGTIARKLEIRQYRTYHEWFNDMKLILENTVKFNGHDHIITVQARRLHNMWVEKLKREFPGMFEVELFPPHLLLLPVALPGLDKKKHKDDDTYEPERKPSINRKGSKRGLYAEDSDFDSEDDDLNPMGQAYRATTKKHKPKGRFNMVSSVSTSGVDPKIMELSTALTAIQQELSRLREEQQRRRMLKKQAKKTVQHVLNQGILASPFATTEEHVVLDPVPTLHVPEVTSVQHVQPLVQHEIHHEAIHHEPIHHEPIHEPIHHEPIHHEIQTIQPVAEVQPIEPNALPAIEPLEHDVDQFLAHSEEEKEQPANTTAQKPKRVRPPAPGPFDPNRRCEFCGTQETPMWRKGYSGHGTMCNQCGVKWAHGKIVMGPDGTLVYAQQAQIQSHQELEPFNAQKRQELTELMSSALTEDASEQQMEAILEILRRKGYVENEDELEVDISALDDRTCHELYDHLKAEQLEREAASGLGIAQEEA